jgi:RNA recognition motif-containing protein
MIAAVLVVAFFIAGVLAWQQPTKVVTQRRNRDFFALHCDSFDDIAHVFVGNLPFGYTEDCLKKLVEDKQIVGCIDSRITLDKKTSKSRGFGFLDFQSAKAANEAISVLTGLEIENRVIKLDLTEGTDSPTKGRRAPVTKKEFSVFIANLDFKLSEADIEGIVTNELGGDVQCKCRLVTFEERSKGFGHVDFGNAEDVAQAVEKLNGKDFMDRTWTVEVAKGVTSAPSPNRSPSGGTGEWSKFSVFLGNLAYEVDVELITEMVGDVVGPNVIKVTNEIPIPIPINSRPAYYIQFTYILYLTYILV